MIKSPPFYLDRSFPLILSLLTLAAFRLEVNANRAAVNFSGDPGLSSQQVLSSTESAGLVPQKFWNTASTKSGQVGVEMDGGTSIGVFISGFTAHWQAAGVGNSSSASVLPNYKLMRGSLLSVPGSSILVQFAGIPVTHTTANGGYALLVYCDAPGNSSDVIMKATVQAGATLRTLYLRDLANRDFSGAFSRAAFSATESAGNIPAGNVFVFTGLTAGDLAVSIEPAESNPGAVVAVNGAQLIPASALPLFEPRITSTLDASGSLNASFSYEISTDIAATSYSATGLPPGLEINPLTGQISGTPTASGRFEVTIRAFNGAGETAETLVLNILGSTQTDLQIYMVPAIRVQGEVGQVHTVEYSDALNPNSWNTAGTVTLTNSAQFYVDLAATNRSKRFYRTRQ
jgi:hypothetical protein